MKRIIFVTLALCLLIGPAFSLPAEQKSEKLEDLGETGPTKNDNENEVNGTVDRGTEDHATENRDTEKDDSSESGPESEMEAFGGINENILSSVSSINGQIEGFVKRSSGKGKLQCRNYTCPEGTVKCEFNSTKPAEDLTVEVHYICRDNADKLLEEKKQTESSQQLGVHNYFSSMFDQIDSFWKRLGALFDRDDSF